MDTRGSGTIGLKYVRFCGIRYLKDPCPGLTRSVARYGRSGVFWTLNFKWTVLGRQSEPGVHFCLWLQISFPLFHFWAFHYLGWTGLAVGYLDRLDGRLVYTENFEKIVKVRKSQDFGKFDFLLNRFV